MNNRHIKAKNLLILLNDVDFWCPEMLFLHLIPTNIKVKVTFISKSRNISVGVSLRGSRRLFPE